MKNGEKWSEVLSNQVSLPVNLLVISSNVILLNSESICAGSKLHCSDMYNMSVRLTLADQVRVMWEELTFLLDTIMEFTTSTSRPRRMFSSVSGRVLSLR